MTEVQSKNVIQCIFSDKLWWKNWNLNFKKLTARPTIEGEKTDDLK